MTQSSDPVNVTTVVQADLRITKTDGLTTVTPGNPISYTIVVTNRGPDNVVGAAVNDPVPAEIKNVSITCTATPLELHVARRAAALDPGRGQSAGQRRRYIRSRHGRPNAAGTLTNTATVAPPAGISNPNPANNQATDVTTITPRADLAVTKTLNNPGPNAGETVTSRCCCGTTAPAMQPA